ncbi:hypothetical protein L208DRAFT_1382829 [Tricholoma matsutake]|nr:hypothetical protein L208DRAFT_1382829 [Tricholoma matsutake 945]
MWDVEGEGGANQMLWYPYVTLHDPWVGYKHHTDPLIHRQGVHRQDYHKVAIDGWDCCRVLTIFRIPLLPVSLLDVHELQMVRKKHVNEDWDNHSLLDVQMIKPAGGQEAGNTMVEDDLMLLGLSQCRSVGGMGVRPVRMVIVFAEDGFMKQDV